MAVLVGADGAAQIDLGGGLKYIANIKSWRCQFKREMLRRTTQADESERRTGGLADWSGDFELHMQFSDDESIALSAWQFLDFAFTGTDDDLKADISLILQSYQLPSECDIFRTTVTGVVKLTGTVVIGDVSLNCEDPERPIIAVVNWEADGGLTLERG